MCIYLFIYQAVTRSKTPTIKQTFAKFNTRILPLCLTYVLFNILGFLGIIALLIPGLIFSIYGMFILVVTATTNKSLYSAFKGSARLVKGRFWTVLGNGILLGLIIMIPVLLVGFATFIFSSIGKLIFNDLISASTIDLLITSIVQLVTATIGLLASIFTTVWYIDLESKVK